MLPLEKKRIDDRIREFHMVDIFLFIPISILCLFVFPEGATIFISFWYVILVLGSVVNFVELITESEKKAMEYRYIWFEKTKMSVLSLMLNAIIILLFFLSGYDVVGVVTFSVMLLNIIGNIVNCLNID